MSKTRPVRAISRALTLSFSSSSSSSSSSFPLKSVTRSNFDSALSELSSHVKNADFVAIDLEMTGITAAPWRESLEFDRSDVRYLKVRDSAEKFAVVQFGVCPFRWDSSNDSFTAHPHNFYIFPRQELSGISGPSTEFLCQTASMDFLAKYQFDFNACIREGISYLSRGQEEEALRHLDSEYQDGLLASWHNFKESRDKPLVNIADILFSERMKMRFGEWRDDLLHKKYDRSDIPGSSNNSMQQLQTIFFKMRPALSLSGFTSRQLQLIQLVLRKHFKDLIYVCMVGGKSHSEPIVVYIDSENDKESLMKEVRDEHYHAAKTKIRSAVGFRHVIDLLSSEKKLIVGHNCFLDVAHIYSKFLGRLPLTVEEFVSSTNKYFPHIIDTKILLNANSVLQNRMKKYNTSLSSAFVSLCPQIALGSKSSHLLLQTSVKVEVHVDDFRSSNWNSGAKHEAGYDAFMTGCVFAQACNLLGIDFKLRPHTENLAHSDKLQQHINLLYLSWNSGDIIDLSCRNGTIEHTGFSSLRKRHNKIFFDNIVIIWGFPSKLKAREIKECFCKAFGPTSVSSVYHLDKSAVFVEFKKADLVNVFLVLKDSLERGNDPISVLHPLSKLLEGGKTRAATYETYKEICSSRSSKVLFADQAEAVGIKWNTKSVASKIAMDDDQSSETCSKTSAPYSISDSAGRTKIGKMTSAADDLMSDQYSCDERIRSTL